MAQFEMIMPKMGESVAEATIIKWLKAEGDKIEADESVLEIATDKVDSEVPASNGGILLKRLFKEGDVVQVGSVIAIIGTDGAAAIVADVVPQTAAKVESAKPVAEAVNIPVAVAETKNDYTNSNKFYSPLVKNIAKQEGISLAELESISGTGKDTRVTKADILGYIANRGKQAPVVAQATETKQIISPQVTVPSKPAVSVGAGDEIIEMDRMRKLIADHMVMSKHTSPHVTSFVEADVTNWNNFTCSKDFNYVYSYFY